MYTRNLQLFLLFSVFSFWAFSNTKSSNALYNSSELNISLEGDTSAASGGLVFHMHTGPAVCNGESTGYAFAHVESGEEPFTVVWSDGGPSKRKRNDLPAGNHSVTITDNNGDTHSENFVITEPTEIQVALNISNATCNGNFRNGGITLNVVGGNAPYMYNWSSGSTLNRITNKKSGNYSVTITDSSGCSVEKFGKISNDICLLEAHLHLENVKCHGENTGTAFVHVLNGVSPFNVVWSDNGASTRRRNNLAAGNYSVTVTDAVGAIYTESFVISQPSRFRAKLKVKNATCDDNYRNGGIDVNISGGTAPYSFNWSTGSNARNLKNRSSGTYNVTITDSNGCVLSRSGNVIDSICPLDAHMHLEAVKCHGDSSGYAFVHVLDGIAPFNIVWSDNGPNARKRTDLPAGNYSVTVTDSVGSVYSDSFIISQPQPLNASLKVLNSTCEGGFADGAAKITAIGGKAPYRFLWNTGNKSRKIRNKTAGLYAVTVTDSVGCKLVKNVSIGKGICPVEAHMHLRPVTCNGDSNGFAFVHIERGVPPYSVLWSDGVTNSRVRLNLTAGNYSVMVTDSLGTTYSESFVISEPAPISFATFSNPVSTVGASNGEVGIDSIMGGTPPYLAEWNPGGIQNVHVLNGLEIGLYEVILTDANNCTQVRNITVNNPICNPIFSGGSIAGSDTVCSGYSGDIISQTAPTGGSGSLDYVWMKSTTDSIFFINNSNWSIVNGQNGESMVTGPIDTTTYFVRLVKDQTCTAFMKYSNVVTMVVPEIEPVNFFIVSYSWQDESCEGNLDGAFELFVDPIFNENDLSFLWNTGDTVKNLTGVGGAVPGGPLSSGQYSITITDNSNCASQVIDNLFLSSQPKEDLIFTSASNFCGNAGGDGVISVHPVDSTIPLSNFIYQWSHDISLTANFALVSNGSYSVTVTDISNGSPGCVQDFSGSIQCIPLNAQINSENEEAKIMEGHHEVVFVDPNIGEESSLTVDVYPNPSTDGLFNIRISSEQNLDDLKVEIYDLLGRKIRTLFQSEDLDKQILDLTQNDILNQGTYFLKVSGSRKSDFKRLIVK